MSVNSPAGVVQAATQVLHQRLHGREPSIGIVLGSGLGALADAVDDRIAVSFGELPGFALAGVTGHRGEMVAGDLYGASVLVQCGRFHLYEGHDAHTVALPVRVMSELGIGVLIVTNAAGGLRRTYRPPTLMLIADHINLMWRNPLIGRVLNGEERFPDMSAPYDGELRAHARRVARAAGVPLEEGVYLGVLGPSYETPAEIRAFERMGADAVGMSTVPEVIAARARGMRCLGVSTITNVAAGLSDRALRHEEVLAAGKLVTRQLTDVIKGVLEQLAAAGN